MAAIAIGALLGGRTVGTLATLAGSLAAYLVHPPFGSTGAIEASLLFLGAGLILSWVFGAPLGSLEAGRIVALGGDHRFALPAGAPLERGLAALTQEVRTVAAGDLTARRVLADGSLSELTAALNALVRGSREFVGVLQDETRRLGEAGNVLHETAATSLAVIEGGAIAHAQLEEGIAEQGRIVGGAASNVRAMSEAIGVLADCLPTAASARPRRSPATSARRSR